MLNLMFITVLVLALLLLPGHPRPGDFETVRVPVEAEDRRIRR